MSEYLLISDAAKEVQVESHVLRYWEEELHLPIKRNELGHRFYTREDVERFRQIKSMKERGLQLKAIKMILKEGRLDLISGLDESWLTGESGSGTAQDNSNNKTDGDRSGEKPGEIAEEKRGEKRSAEQGEDRKEKSDVKPGKGQSEKSEVRSGEKLDVKPNRGQSQKSEVRSGERPEEKRRERPGQEAVTDPCGQPVNPKGQVEASSRKKVNLEEKTLPVEERAAEPCRKDETCAEVGEGPAPGMGIEILESRDLQEVSRPNPEDRSRRLQWLLRQMMQEAVRENNEELCRSIKESVIKELDYQFRMQEERQEERDHEILQRGEEYYRRMDELLRQRSGRKKTNRQEFLKGTVSEAKENKEKRKKEKNDVVKAMEENLPEKAQADLKMAGKDAEQAAVGEAKTESPGKRTIFRFWAPGRKTV